MKNQTIYFKRFNISMLPQIYRKFEKIQDQNELSRSICLEMIAKKRRSMIQNLIFENIDFFHFFCITYVQTHK